MCVCTICLNNFQTVKCPKQYKVRIIGVVNWEYNMHKEQEIPGEPGELRVKDDQE